MGWGSICRRRMRLFSMALIIFLDYKFVQQRAKWTSKSQRSVLWEKTHERNAKRVLNLSIELEGLWVKLGQYLSTRADVLPGAYISLLKQLQDSLPPRPLHEVTQTIEKELGQSMDVLFMDFVKNPLATASIAQVHRATLIDGQQVVVKVQHQGIKTIILKDLKDAKSIVDWIAWAEPQYDFNPIMDEWCKETPKELDFNLEAENTRVVSRNLGCIKRFEDDNLANKVDVLIPEVIQSSEAVLILEYMDGIRLNDSESLEACGVDKQKLVEEITRAYAHQIYVDGIFNGDPHPGNFLVSKEAPHRPILLDFGLTKKLSNSMKQAVAKMFLASAEGDHVALLSAFAEMGLKLRLDLPEQAMEVTTVLFSTSTLANEAQETIKNWSEKRMKNMKVIQEKMKLSQKEVKRFNPIDAFPGDIVIFSRVLELLRGLSSTLNVRIVYLDIMRPFAESVLRGNINKGPTVNPQWIYDTPVNSDVEAKLRQLLVEMGNDNKILGIQVCAYKDGEVIIDTAAGVLGRYDPRPVQPDSLFNVFSTTKGVTAGMLHWLVDNGKLKLEENVANIWPEFGSNGKEIIKHASGKKFQEILEEAFIQPLNIEGELYVGIPPGVESQLASLTLDTDGLNKLPERSPPPELPSTFQIDKIAQLATTMPVLFNMLNTRRAIIPAANGHCSARALARYYATLVDGGVIPPPHSSLSKPPLGSHTHIPKFSSQEKSKESKRKKSKEATAASDNKTKTHEQNPQHSKDFKDGSHKRDAGGDGHTRLDKGSSSGSMNASVSDSIIIIDDNNNAGKIFKNPRLHDAFLGVGEYENLALPNGQFGLGFKTNRAQDGSLVGFGHSGMGGSTGFCDIKNRFAIAVTLNKMSFGTVTAKIIQFVCSELNIPQPVEFSSVGDSEKPLIN
ncbi:uncharacterized protein LOC123200774 isoform X2 [Mangifera indica]|uniref:uncharacterized protein LOC123200774 isoform X2 n=1 Tax=Mangifera indica TaxID=29780 RepID=UPI001CFB04A8|nr:uncharacterized protein LOC123200774 isoform X2 [Mangifera indica]